MYFKVQQQSWRITLGTTADLYSDSELTSLITSLIKSELSGFSSFLAVLCGLIKKAKEIKTKINGEITFQVARHYSCSETT